MRGILKRVSTPIAQHEGGSSDSWSWCSERSVTVDYADALLKATLPDQRTDFKPTERDKQLAPIEQIVKLEKEMSQVLTQFKDA